MTAWLSAARRRPQATRRVHRARVLARYPGDRVVREADRRTARRAAERSRADRHRARRAECSTGPGAECVQICPAGTHPIAGSCDATAGSSLSENRASVADSAPFPPSPAPFTAYDRWVCETASGNMQFPYALCCP